MNYTEDKDQNLLSYIYCFLRNNILYFSLIIFIVFSIITATVFYVEIKNPLSILEFNFLKKTEYALLLSLFFISFSIVISSTVYKIINPKNFNFFAFLLKIVSEIPLFIVLFFLGYLCVLGIMYCVFTPIIFPVLLYISCLIFMFCFYSCIILSFNSKNYFQRIKFLFGKKAITSFTDLTRYIIIIFIILFGIPLLFNIIDQLVNTIFRFKIVNDFTMNVFKIISIVLGITFTVGYIIYLNIVANKQYEFLIGNDILKEIEDIGSKTIDDEI